MTTDRMQMGDGFSMGLECGHPNKNAGETCELCGQVVPGAPEVQSKAAPEEPAQEQENGK
jgi:hypothetical protein